MTNDVPATRPADDVFHLLTADDDLAHPYVSSHVMTVCGEPVLTSDLPPSCYPPGCESNRDPRYCPECVHEALRWSADGSKSSGH
ncbi:MAG: hypothetical protein ACRDRW_17730 [Pseudonocardiaceae bacterium]